MTIDGWRRPRPDEAGTRWRENVDARLCGESGSSMILFSCFAKSMIYRTRKVRTLDDE